MCFVSVLCIFLNVCPRVFLVKTKGLICRQKGWTPGIIWQSYWLSLNSSVVFLQTTNSSLGHVLNFYFFFLKIYVSISMLIIKTPLNSVLLHLNYFQNRCPKHLPDQRLYLLGLKSCLCIQIKSIHKKQ